MIHAIHRSHFNRKLGLTLAVITCQVLCISCQSIPRPLAPSGATNLPLQLAVNLTDGSRLIGTTALTTFPLRSEALGTMPIPLDKVRSLKFSPDHESVIVSLANGDKLQGSLGAVSLKLQTPLGLVTVPLEHTAAIDVRQGSVQNPPAGLVLWYRFDVDEGDHVTDWSGHDNHGSVQDAKHVTTVSQFASAIHQYCNFRTLQSRCG